MFEAYTPPPKVEVRSGNQDAYNSNQGLKNFLQNNGIQSQPDLVTTEITNFNQLVQTLEQNNLVKSYQQDFATLIPSEFNNNNQRIAKLILNIIGKIISEKPDLINSQQKMFDLIVKPVNKAPTNVRSSNSSWAELTLPTLNNGRIAQETDYIVLVKITASSDQFGNPVNIYHLWLLDPKAKPFLYNYRKNYSKPNTGNIG